MLHTLGTPKSVGQYIPDGILSISGKKKKKKTDGRSNKRLFSGSDLLCRQFRRHLKSGVLCC